MPRRGVFVLVLFQMPLAMSLQPHAGLDSEWGAPDLSQVQVTVINATDVWVAAHVGPVRAVQRSLRQHPRGASAVSS